MGAVLEVMAYYGIYIYEDSTRRCLYMWRADTRVTPYRICLYDAYIRWWYYIWKVDTWVTGCRIYMSEAWVTSRLSYMSDPVERTDLCLSTSLLVNMRGWRFFARWHACMYKPHVVYRNCIWAAHCCVARQGIKCPPAPFNLTGYTKSTQCLIKPHQKNLLCSIQLTPNKHLRTASTLYWGYYKEEQSIERLPTGRRPAAKQPL